jgi:hypothetical protein
VEWFRVYSSILDKPNVGGLDAETLGYWLLFMAHANRATPRGSLPVDPVELGWAIHRDPKAVSAMVDRLVQAGLLERDGDGIRFHKWSLYQPPSTARTAAHKASKQEHEGTSGNTGEHSGTSGNTREPREKREKRGEEKEETPLPPTGGERAGLTSEDPETLSVCRWANDLVTGWGPLAEGACQNYPAAWVREACSIAREAKASRWKFVDSILGRFKSQGGPDSARAPTTPRNTIAEKLGGGTLAERKARTKAIFEDLDRRNGVA